MQYHRAYSNVRKNLKLLYYCNRLFSLSLIYWYLNCTYLNVKRRNIMQKINKIRRQFLKSTVVLPLIYQTPWQQVVANTPSDESFIHPYNVLKEFYGERANHIRKTNKLKLESPDIAENNAVVPVTVKMLGENFLVNSVALFVLGNSQPLVQTVKLSPYVSLPLKWRIKMDQTSDIVLIAETEAGLIGVKKHTRVVFGCEG